MDGVAAKPISTALCNAWLRERPMSGLYYIVGGLTIGINCVILFIENKKS
jgi:hypothetical protein